MHLSGNSPRKMTGKTATTMAKFTATFLAGPKGLPSSRPQRHGWNEGCLKGSLIRGCTTESIRTPASTIPRDNSPEIAHAQVFGGCQRPYR